MSSSRSWPLLACILLAGRTAVGAAQDRVFPHVPAFELPEASPRVHGVVGRIISARRGDSDFGAEPEADVAIGENFPVLALREGPKPVTLGFGTQVYGRFSLSDKKSALISNDWVVELNTTALIGAWSLTGEIYHESSHLGDEYSERFGDTRLDWTREVAAAWLSYGRGPLRLTGNLSYVLIDQLDLDRPGGALAADYEGRPFGRLLGSPIRAVGGVFFESWAATHWRVSTSAKLGIALSRSDGGREIGLALIAHDGLSTQRQFFRRESRYIGGELRFDL
jgi:Protein of unknown function (DUF1207)